MQEEVTDHIPATEEELRKAAELLQKEASRYYKMTDAQRSAFLEAVTTNPLIPKGWSPTTSAPYYKEKYALMLKKELDLMYDNRTKDRKFFCDDTNMSRRTLYLRINQAWLYLVQHMDKEPLDKYRTLRQEIEVKKEKDGVRLSWKHLKTISGEEVERLVAEEVPLHSAFSKWKTELCDFIETAIENQKLSLINLDLDQTDIDYINNLIEPLKEFHIIRLSRTVLRVVKNSSIPRAKSST